MTGSDGELEGVYRFLSNARVTPSKVLEPHLAATVERARREDRVLVVHDTTTFRFGGAAPREGLGWLHREGGAQGFLGHFALALSGDGTRRPLGLVGLSTIARRGKPLGRKTTGRERFNRDEKESDRWMQMALAVHEGLPAAIHVMDREADAFDLFETLVVPDAKFVIRGREALNRVAFDEGDRVPVSALSAAEPVRLTRTVALSRRKPNSYRVGKVANKFNPPRDERTARLEIRCRSILIPRPTTQSRRKPTPLPVNVVWVREVDAPAGEDPVSWMLVTNLPVATRGDLEFIVDAYRARWVIEEYFKALKTGCAFEKRQLETMHALMNALAVFSVIAWRLLLLRTVARDDPAGRPDHVLTRRQAVLLSALSESGHPRFRRVRLPTTPTAQDALMAIAGLGGHIANNGVPGWQVLGRGYDALLLLELGWQARDEM